MAKAIIFERPGGPNVLKYKDINVKKPGYGEALVENHVIGLNFIDTYHRSGLYPLPLPSGIGLEAAGIIEKAGNNVGDFKEGDKVAYAAAPVGSYASHRIYPVKSLVKVPDGIDLEIVACLMTKGLTTFYLLHKTYPVKKGQTVLFHAAAGGVGQIFCQWAKSLGCKVIGTVGSDEKIKLAEKYGCDEVINYNKENFKDKVFKLEKFCNYILDQMSSDNKDFSEALKNAKELGYAEADPTFDIGGFDAAHKISILAMLAYNIKSPYKNMHIEGIESI